MYYIVKPVNFELSSILNEIKANLVAQMVLWYYVFLNIKDYQKHFNP